MVADYAELKEKIREALRGMVGVSVDENGFYYTECDKDYRDELSDEQIADVLSGRFRFRVDGKERFEEMEPMDALYGLLADGYQEELWRIEDDLLGELKKNEDLTGWMAAHDIDEDGLKECLNDVWYVQPPVEDYLKQDVCMDIMLDTGDANYEFTCNNLASSDIESVEDFDENSSLLWLCEQQGVTREELLAAFEKGTAHSDEVIGLRARKAELVAELQGFGFVAPRFAERVVHTGAYQEYARLQAQLGKLSKEMQSLQEKHTQNSLSYQEYLKRHFDRFERLDPMPEEQFIEKRKEILEHFDVKLKAAGAEYARVKDQLDFRTDYRRIAVLQSEYHDVKRHLDALSQTEDYKKAEFVNSVVEEVRNMSSHMAAVTFLVKMPLEEAIRLQEVIDGEASLNHSYNFEDRTGQGVIVLDKETRVGLFDPCGGGSLFNIAIWKDVEIPLRAIGAFGLDAARGEYSFMSIYGENDEGFEESLKEIREAPQHEMVENILADAALRSNEGGMPQAPGDRDCMDR